ncbi:hypothetical protein J5X07_04360 [Actinomyces bowdenii]|uniref:hypothetical protein n=1 Tax=Actinomyces bowdenii TaxID=131109 RepID=UPI001ABC9C80|nr:hypothetical protein [Actinomyces bowdenii]MBO3724267.1 hypothetical protein [Actinomyces bowdenii]
MTPASRDTQDPAPQRPAPGAPAAPRPAPSRRPVEPQAPVPDHSRIEQIQGLALEERAPALEALREELAAALHQDGPDQPGPAPSTSAGGGQASGNPRD